MHQGKNIAKPGQSCSLQGLVWEASPTQSKPPLAGAGLVQVLVLVCVPSPQFAEHSDHSPNSVYPPFTEKVFVRPSFIQFVY